MTNGTEPLPPRFEPPSRLLMGPGPSAVHPRVLAAMARPMIGHLDPATMHMLDEIKSMLRHVFRTHNELTFPVSGTGTAGMECALQNVLEPGDLAVVAVSGFFAERMREIASRCGAEVETVGGKWAEPVSASDIAAALKRRPAAKVVSVVHGETSTGLLQPLGEIGEVCRTHGALLVVDCVATLGGVEVDVDGWGIDVCYSGSQKCLSAPPGLAPITFSPRAVAAREGRVGPARSFYLDALFIWKYLGSERVYHHTAPVSMLYALHEALRIVMEEGLEARWQRHMGIGAETMAALEERGFYAVPADGYRMPQVICVSIPDALGDEKLARTRLREEFGIEVAGGLDEFAGKVWRVGLMGESCNRDYVRALLSAVDEILAG